MAKDSIYDYDTSAGGNTDIGGIGINGSNNVSNFDGALRELMAQIADDVSPRRMSIRGAIFGLTLSNNTGDATNDIDIAAGMATTDTAADPRTMVLASSITKRLDAAWAVGTNQGGLDTGSIANTWYHLWLIQRSDTGVVDALFSTSATSPTMPANYDRKRRIGAVVRGAGTLLAFRQFGDRFLYAAPVTNRSSTSPVTDTLVAVSSPLGVRCRPILISSVSSAAASVVQNFVGDGDGSAASHVYQQVGGSSQSSCIIDPVYTDTSSQIRFSAGASGSITANILQCAGWYDDRGRMA